MSILTHISPLDIAASLWFLCLWFGFSFILDRTAFGRGSLSSIMDLKRAAWMQTMKTRDLRIVDTSIMAGLQQGTAFFASTSLLAIGGSFALMNAAEDVLMVFHRLPVSVEMTPAEWQIKIIGLLLIYTYTFFKFGWAYRLFNYASMLLGAVPDRDGNETVEKIEQSVESVTQMTVLAGKHFNRGLMAFFFAIGYLGWFINAAVFIGATTFVLLVLVRRQFFSASLRVAKIGL
ncbi:MAG: hypothetical protein COA52_06125 [Hyphomicrobiales bacterium]|nr:MAG: hypothetical protein COA52_06125 [Hyphomicrobiales bacterium]